MKFEHVTLKRTKNDQDYGNFAIEICLSPDSGETFQALAEIAIRTIDAKIAEWEARSALR